MFYHIYCGLFPHAVPGCTRYVLTIEHQQQIDVFMIYRRLLSHVLMIMKIMTRILIEAYCLGSYGNGNGSMSALLYVDHILKSSIVVRCVNIL